MLELSKLLQKHKKKYPLMEITDAVKLIYQNEFGGGHMISDANASLAYLENEYAGLSASESADLFENIGNRILRMNIAAVNKRQLQLLNRLFVLSANSVKGRMDAFEEKLLTLTQLCENEPALFSVEALAAYLDTYRERGCPPVSHSATYRKAYTPAYRIVCEKYAGFWPLLAEIARKLDESGRVTVAIDGKCGSGKTTLASIIGEVFADKGTSTIAMDDFFLPPEKRTPKRYQEPGGNVDYERFYDEVAVKLASTAAFSYNVFDCSQMMINGTKTVADIKTAPVRIVEGSYSMRTELRGFYDIKVFTDIDEESQHRRILQRNGAEMLKRFICEWIPLENRYFEAFEIRDNCDFIFEEEQSYE